MSEIITYSDGTPNLAYTYNRLGQQATVADTTGTRTLNYNLSGTLEQQNEDLPAFFGSRRITYPSATSGVTAATPSLVVMASAPFFQRSVRRA